MSRRERERERGGDLHLVDLLNSCIVVQSLAV